ncbi:MAG: gliding motility-associated-like protein [Parvicella sp.]|jgi:gliding motility-associated-like protein
MTLGEVYAPNSFTPNGDGLNDVFYVHIIEDYINSVELKIYNRSKIAVYTSNESYNSWNGQFKEELAQNGIYYWQLKYQDNSGEEKYVEGTVNLIEQ